MPAVKGLLGQKDVALGAPGLGSVSLLQDHNCIPHVAVCKMNLEVGTTRRPTQATCYLVPELRQVFWEGYQVSLGLPRGYAGGGVGIPPPQSPHPLYAGSGSVSVEKALPPQLRTPGIPPYSPGAPKKLVPSPSSASCRPPLTSHLAHGMAGIPRQPYLTCFSVGRPY